MSEHPATSGPKADLRIVMAPPKGGLCIVLLLVWLFAGCTYALVRLTGDEVSFLTHVLVFAFPVLISYYALRSLLGDSGKLVLERGGFSLTLPSGGTAFFQWDKVEAFGTHVFGDPIVTETGVEAARFAHIDGKGERRIVGLTNNLKYSGAALAEIMEYARLQAEKGWPQPPVDQEALAMAALGVDNATALKARLKAWPTGSSRTSN